MFAASRPDESISGDAGRKKKKGVEKKKKTERRVVSGRIKTAFGGEAAKKPRNLLCNFFFCFRC